MKFSSRFSKLLIFAGTSLFATAAIAQTPAINSFAPDTAAAGTFINIMGVNFGGATSVAIGGVPAPHFYVYSDIQIAAGEVLSLRY